MLKKASGTYPAKELLGEELRNAEIGELLTAVVCKLVNTPSEVKVEFVELESLTVLEFAVGQGDVGKAVGRDGRLIDALRTLAYAMLGANGESHRRCEIGVRSGARR